MQPDIEHPEVTYHRPAQQQGYGRAYQHQESGEEFVELQHKRESDI